MPKFRTITGQFVGYVPDGTDPDINPDRETMNGRVTFTPVFTGGVIAFPELSPPEFAHPEPISARIIDGFVQVQVGTDDDVSMQPLSLMVTVDDEASQVWSWRAEFTNMRIGSGEVEVQIPAWSFRVPDGTGPVDLTELVPLKTSTTVDVTKGPRGAGLQTITAQNGELVFEYTDGEQATIPVPEAVQGPEGPRGPAGADGEQGPQGEKGDPGEIPDLLVGNITDATPTGKNLMLAATEGAARNALGLQAGATASNGSLAELETGTSNTPRVWAANNIAGYVAGATSELVNDAKIVLNVKDFGAAGDGITDDTLAIRSCIDSATGAAQTTVYFPPGDYLIPRGTHLNAATWSPGTSQFTRRVFEVSSNVKIVGQNATILHDGDYAWRKVLFYVKGSNVHFEGMTFTNTYDMSGGSRPTDIPIAGGSAFDLNAPNISNISIRKCTFNRSWHPTKFAVDDTGQTVTGVDIAECTTNSEPTSDSSGGHNFVSRPPGNITDLTVDRNKVYDMSVSAAIGLYGAHRATVSNNICKRSGINGAGIQLENGADHVTISGNVLEDHFNHVWVDDSTNVTIMGNSAMNLQKSDSYKGIRVTYQGHAYNASQRVTNIVANGNILTNCRIVTEQFSSVEPGSTPSLGDITISNNHVHLDPDSTLYGISTAPGSSVLVSGNIVVGASTRSIRVSTGAAAPAEAVVVTGNYTNKVGTESSYGFELVGAYGGTPIVEGNKFVNSVYYSRVLYGSVGALNLVTGRGDPTGVVSAPRGSLFVRTDGANSSEVLYVKSGDGQIGWMPK